MECSSSGILYYIASTNSTAVTSIASYEEIKNETQDYYLSEIYSLPIPSHQQEAANEIDDLINNPYLWIKGF